MGASLPSNSNCEECRKTSSGAPFVRRITLPSGFSTSTDIMRRVKSNGSSSSFLYFSTASFPWKSGLSRIARSSRFLRPVWKWLIRYPSNSTSSLSRPATLQCRMRTTRSSVRVPVLSVHNTSMPPKFWMALRRLTITFLRLIPSAPLARQTVPAQAFQGVFRGSDIHRSEQEPLDSLGSGGRRRFHRMNHPDVEGIFVRMMLRRTKLNPLVTHLHIGLTAGPVRTGLFLAELRTSALARHADLHFRLQGRLPDGFKEFEGLVHEAAVVVGAD